MWCLDAQPETVTLADGSHVQLYKDGEALREIYLKRVSDLLTAVALSPEPPNFDSFNTVTRRTEGSAPDEQTIRRVRGDKNRIFLMD